MKLSLFVLGLICLTGCSNPADEFVTVQRTSGGFSGPVTTKTKVVKVSEHTWRKNRDGEYVITGNWSPESPEDAKKVQAYLDSK